MCLCVCVCVCRWLLNEPLMSQLITVERRHLLGKKVALGLSAGTNLVGGRVARVGLVKADYMCTLECSCVHFE